MKDEDACVDNFNKQNNGQVKGSRAVEELKIEEEIRIKQPLLDNKFQKAIKQEKQNGGGYKALEIDFNRKREQASGPLP